MPKLYVYIFLRSDLPVEQLIVQSSHAAYESAAKYSSDDGNHPSMVIIHVKDSLHLEKIRRHLLASDVSHTEFFEPDWSYGVTAIATAPVETHQRHLFKKFQVFKRKHMDMTKSLPTEGVSHDA